MVKRGFFPHVGKLETRMSRLKFTMAENQSINTEIVLSAFKFEYIFTLGIWPSKVLLTSQIADIVELLFCRSLLYSFLYAQ